MIMKANKAISMEGGISEMSKQELQQKGFTIIEVVLVLAIAALIFLMVFIALPALQRNQRDQALKTVQGKVVSAIGSYQSSHRNNQYTNTTDLASYLDVPVPATAGATLANVDGYTLSTVGSIDYTGATNDTIYIVKNSKCDSDGTTTVPGSSRNAAVLVKPENGAALVCQAA